MTGAPISFNDGKAPDAMRTIGEVADGLGIRQHILRYWEQQFPMLQPLKRSGGRRLYRPDDVAMVATIDRLVNREGYTLKGAKAVLQGGAPAARVTVTQNTSTVPVAASDGIRGRLIAIRDRLDRALQVA
jgi:DNA-binding transcriptional MerR regulator